MSMNNNHVHTKTKLISPELKQEQQNEGEVVYSNLRGV